MKNLVIILLIILSSLVSFANFKDVISNDNLYVREQEDKLLIYLSLYTTQSEYLNEDGDLVLQTEKVTILMDEFTIDKSSYELSDDQIKEIWKKGGDTYLIRRDSSVSYSAFKKYKEVDVIVAVYDPSQQHLSISEEVPPIPKESVNVFFYLCVLGIIISFIVFFLTRLSFVGLIFYYLYFLVFYALLNQGNNPDIIVILFFILSSFAYIGVYTYYNKIFDREDDKEVKINVKLHLFAGLAIYFFLFLSPVWYIMYGYEEINRSGFILIAILTILLLIPGWFILRKKMKKALRPNYDYSKMDVIIIGSFLDENNLDEKN